MLAGLVTFLACTKLKNALGYDDALDTFGVHAVGGTLGAFVTGIFASTDVNPNLATNLKDIVGQSLWIEQLKAIGVTLVLERRWHGDSRLHRQGRRRPPADARRTRKRASTSPITASAATT